MLSGVKGITDRAADLHALRTSFIYDMLSKTLDRYQEVAIHPCLPHITKPPGGNREFGVSGDRQREILASVPHEGVEHLLCRLVCHHEFARGDNVKIKRLPCC